MDSDNMPNWERQFRAAARILPLSGLRELRDAIKRNDPSIIRGSTVVVAHGTRSPNNPINSGREIVACCALGFALWKATDDERTAIDPDMKKASLESQILAGFIRAKCEMEMVGKVDGAGLFNRDAYGFVRWFDSLDRSESLPQLLPVVESVIAERSES